MAFDMFLMSYVDNIICMMYLMVEKCLNWNAITTTASDYRFG